MIDLHQAMQVKPGAIGRDGVTPSTLSGRIAEEAALISRKVKNQTYQFTRYREKLISKGPRKHPRVISIPTQRDRLTLRALYNFLDGTFPNAGTRKPHKYISEIRDAIKNRSTEDLSFLRLDIREYYPNINQDILLKTIRQKTRKKQAIKLISDAIRTETLKGIPERGVPQGLSISNLLAAIHLSKFDEAMSARWPYFRYVDDILIVCKTGDELEAFNHLRAELKKMHLECHDIDEKAQKTYFAPIEKGINYLGFHIAKDKISVREISYKKMITNILSVITANRDDVDKLLWKLNLKISGCVLDGKRFGWMHFFSMTENVSQLKRLDKFVSDQIDRNKLQNIKPRVKKFVRAYHEIRYDSGTSKYIPNFDTYLMDDMLSSLHNLGIDTSRMTEEEVKYAFLKNMRREVSALERDLIDPNS